MLIKKRKNWKNEKKWFHFCLITSRYNMQMRLRFFFIWKNKKPPHYFDFLFFEWGKNNENGASVCFCKHGRSIRLALMAPRFPFKVECITTPRYVQHFPFTFSWMSSFHKNFSKITFWGNIQRLRKTFKIPNYPRLRLGLMRLRVKRKT